MAKLSLALAALVTIMLLGVIHSQSRLSPLFLMRNSSLPPLSVLLVSWRYVPSVRGLQSVH